MSIKPIPYPIISDRADFNTALEHTPVLVDFSTAGYSLYFPLHSPKIERLKAIITVHRAGYVVRRISTNKTYAHFQPLPGALK